MKRRALVIIISVFVVQIFISCFDDDCSGDCSDGFIYEQTYSGVSLIPFNTLGTDKEVYKDTFGMLISMELTSEAITRISKKTIISNFGFSSAYACSPCEPNYIYSNSIQAVKIYMNEEDSEQRIDVTKSFKIEDYSYATDSNSTFSLQEFFPIEDKAYYDWYNAFNVKLTSYNNILDSVFFEIEVELDTGIILTSQSDLITFID